MSTWKMVGNNLTNSKQTHKCQKTQKSNSRVVTACVHLQNSSSHLALFFLPGHGQLCHCSARLAKQCICGSEKAIQPSSLTSACREMAMGSQCLTSKSAPPPSPNTLPTHHPPSHQAQPLTHTHTHPHTQTHRRTNRQGGRKQRDRQRQAARQAERQAGRQTDKQRNRKQGNKHTITCKSGCVS